MPSADLTLPEAAGFQANMGLPTIFMKRVGKTYGNTETNPNLKVNLKAKSQQKPVGTTNAKATTRRLHNTRKNKEESENMKKKWLIIAAAAVAVCGAGGVAQATTISGNITFAGGVELNTSSAGTATEVTAWTGADGTGDPIVISSDGSFSGITPGTDVTFTAPWFFNSGAVADLWSVGGFTFNLTSSEIVFQGGSPAIVGVDGTGVVTEDGVSQEMSWSFSTSDPGAAGANGTLIFSFQAASGTITPTVPDGGTTAMLLGLGVLGLGLVKKQILA